MQKADFATQHLHQVTILTSAHLHLPQVIGVTCAILTTEQRWRCVLSLGLGDIQIYEDMQSESYMFLMLNKAINSLASQKRNKSNFNRKQTSPGSRLTCHLSTVRSSKVKKVIFFSGALCYGSTHNAIACDLEVFLGQRGFMEVTVKVTGCSKRSTVKQSKLHYHKNMHIIWIGMTLNNVFHFTALWSHDSYSLCSSRMMSP